MNRQFQAERPNQLWAADFSYVAAWAGVVFVAFVIDVYARRTVDWRVSRSMRAELVLDALVTHKHEPTIGRPIKIGA